MIYFLVSCFLHVKKPKEINVIRDIMKRSNLLWNKSFGKLTWQFRHPRDNLLHHSVLPVTTNAFFLSFCQLRRQNWSSRASATDHWVLEQAKAREWQKKLITWQWINWKEWNMSPTCVLCFGPNNSPHGRTYPIYKQGVRVLRCHAIFL